MAKDYVVGLLGGLVLALAVAVLYVATEPKEETGLAWGNKVYTSKQEFKGYLKSKGLSYKIWLARNPGAAPWEPAVEPRASAAADRSSRSPLLPAAFGMVLGAVCSFLLVRRRSREAIAGLVGGLAAHSSERFDGGVHVDAEDGTLRARRVGAGSVAFSVIGVLTAAMFLLFVLVLATA